MLGSPIYTYSDTTPQKRIVTDGIEIIDPADKATIDALGGFDSAAGKFKFSGGKGTKVEWLEDTLAPTTGALDGTITSTATTITVVDATKYQIGHIIEVVSEGMWVSAVNESTEVLTVTRAYSGTASTAAASAVVNIVGMARLEGADSSRSPYTDRTANSNYTQIYHKEIKVTRTQSQISQWGIANEFDYQAMKAVPELTKYVSKGLFKGQRKAGSATTPRAAGGFPTYITSNLQTAGGSAVTAAVIKSALKKAWDDGGNGPWIIPCSSANMNNISAFLDSSNFLRVGRDEKAVGMNIEAIETPYGRATFVLDRWADTNRMEVIDASKAGLLTFYPFTQEPLAQDGDSITGQVIGEYTLCVKSDKAHAAITSVIA